MENGDISISRPTEDAVPEDSSASENDVSDRNSICEPPPYFELKRPKKNKSTEDQIFGPISAAFSPVHSDLGKVFKIKAANT